ncbi:acetamidase/formamidase family protein [Radicibacter daui]|uniref:acetamidase/formamidase family protein n=1 Tax=Radicibacter daui TaxID=3064829 RepID=UPI004046A7FC
MNIRQFASESYPQATRRSAWQDLLGELNLKSDQPGDHPQAFATAALRGSTEGLTLARLTAGDQTLRPLNQRARILAALLPLDEELTLRLDGAENKVPPGQLIILPTGAPWETGLQKSGRVIVLSGGERAFQGRRAGFRPATKPLILARQGVAAVLIRALEAGATELDQLSQTDWQALEQVYADLLLAVTSEAESLDAAATPGHAALFNRVTLSIEKHLQDPDLSASRIARLEGISDRYLQKLFEQNGESFGHYLRERRLQRARAALVAPGDIRTPVAEVAYNSGFGDAANFNRLFKERFGMPPGAFRSHHTDRAEIPATEQRGWPVKALAGKKPALRVEPSAGPGSFARPAEGATDHRLTATSQTVHWGYFSRSLRPVLEIEPGDTVEVETLTQHASDDPERMIKGDKSAEDVFFWSKDHKAVDRRGAGPIDASIFGRGAGEGFGVHICTGPIHVKGAEPGDVIEVRIDDIRPRLSGNPAFAGRCFGSNVAAWWGYHYGELLEEPKQRETVTIYEILADAGDGYAKALYSYRWAPQTDPYGVVHRTYDYPGVPVDPESVDLRLDPMPEVRIPLRPHFGVIALAPREVDLVDSVPPAYFGGNLDNWRLGRGSAIYLPVSVTGGLLSIGDPHATQGDSELSGTAIECSMTGRFTIQLHKKGGPLSDLTYPLIETPDEWILTGFSHPNYLAEFGATGQGEVYAKSSLDLAMKDAFRKARRFLMGTHGLDEDEAVSLMSAAVDFGVTQVVDGNWGVHAIIRKALFNR